MRKPELEPAAAELILAIAQKQGRPPCDVIAEAFGLAVVAIDARLARRLAQVDSAAGLERGSMLRSLIEVSDHWWSNMGSLLESYVCEGWELEDEPKVKRKIRALVRKWAKEDAAEAAPQPAGELSGLAAEIAAQDRSVNDRAKALQAESQKPCTVLLDAELADAAEKHFAGTPYGSLSGFVEAAIRRNIAGGRQ